MGINSTEVSYGFGQMGSAYTSAAASIIPPKGLVIVAIQFLADNTPTILRTEKTTNALVVGNTGESYFGTTYVAHNNGDAQQAIVNKSSGDLTSHTLSAANAAIKVGMQVFSNTQNLLQDITGEVPACVVAAIDAEDIRFNRNVVGATTTLTFSELNGTGDGGEAVSGVIFPKGVTIYGRWVEVKPAADANGGVICYFGV
jgi:hypothetical protein